MRNNMKSLFEVISNVWKQIKNYIIVFCTAFVLGCALSGTIMYKVSGDRANKYRAELELLRSKQSDSQDTISRLNSELERSTTECKQLTSRIDSAKSNATAATATISSTDEHIKNIRESVQKIRTLNKDIEDNIGDSDTCNSASNNSRNIKN